MHVTMILQKGLSLCLQALHQVCGKSWFPPVLFLLLSLGREEFCSPNNHYHYLQKGYTKWIFKITINLNGLASYLVLRNVWSFAYRLMSFWSPNWSLCSCHIGLTLGWGHTPSLPRHVSWSRNQWEHCSQYRVQFRPRDLVMWSRVQLLAAIILGS